MPLQFTSRPNLIPPETPSVGRGSFRVHAHLPIAGHPVSVSGAPVASRPKHAGRIAAEKLFNRPWAISKAALQALVAEYVVRNASGYEDEEEENDLCPYLLTEDGIACIPISGPLSKRSYWRMTYGEISGMCAHAAENASVKAILFCVDSPGGEVSGMFDLCNQIYGMRGQKPMAAISDDSCYSAAYCLATAADKIFVTQTGGVGSIGCWMAHVDYSELLKNEGIKVTYVFSGEKKVDGNATEPLSDRAREDMQEESDRIRAMFVQAVARNRGVSADALFATEAGIYMAEKGLPLLADNLGTVEDALGYLRGCIAAPQQDPFDPDDEEQDDPFLAKTESEIVKPALEAEVEAFISNPSITIAEMFRSASAETARGWMDYVQADATDTDPILAVRCRGLKASVSEEGSGRTITCCVAPYDQLSCDFGGFKEVYSPGCFKKSLDAGDDARALFNHNPEKVLGRRSAGTARFYEKPDGLYFEVEAPDTSFADDLLVSMRRGDITGGSAAFFILKPRWEYRGNEKVRVIEEARLVEGSVASFPIYETTQATAATTAAAEVTPAAESQPEQVVYFGIQAAKLELLRLR